MLTCDRMRPSPTADLVPAEPCQAGRDDSYDDAKTRPRWGSSKDKEKAKTKNRKAAKAARKARKK